MFCAARTKGLKKKNSPKKITICRIIQLQAEMFFSREDESSLVDPEIYQK